MLKCVRDSTHCIQYLNPRQGGDVNLLSYTEKDGSEVKDSALLLI